MNKKLLFSLLLAGTAFTGHADEARLLRFPATNGSDIVFSYAGDLYKAPLNGGEAQKLTSHIGYEMFARFSPDGKSIAFTGQYDGNTEVYLIPTDGGEPQRLTYTATNNRDDLGDRMMRRTDMGSSLRTFCRQSVKRQRNPSEKKYGGGNRS